MRGIEWRLIIIWGPGLDRFLRFRLFLIWFYLKNAPKSILKIWLWNFDSRPGLSSTLFIISLVIMWVLCHWLIIPLFLDYLFSYCCLYSRSHTGGSPSWTWLVFRINISPVNIRPLNSLWRCPIIRLWVIIVCWWRWAIWFIILIVNNAGPRTSQYLTLSFKLHGTL